MVGNEHQPSDFEIKLMAPFRKACDYFSPPVMLPSKFICSDTSAICSVFKPLP
jgi:hypothetical protein